jgi:urease accessory protein
VNRRLFCRWLNDISFFKGITAMRRFERVVPDNEANTRSPANLTLPYELRRKSRQLARLDDGEEVGLLLPPGTILRDGDTLESTDGYRVRITAAAEPVLRVTSNDTQTLIRAAYHLGNRHTPVEVGDGFLRLETDRVLKEMLLGLGAKVEERMEPFNPEPGAYGGGHRHNHHESVSHRYPD